MAAEFESGRAAEERAKATALLWWLPAAAQRSAGEKPANAVVKVAREARRRLMFSVLSGGYGARDDVGQGLPPSLAKGGGGKLQGKKKSVYILFLPPRRVKLRVLCAIAIQSRSPAPAAVAQSAECGTLQRCRRARLSNARRPVGLHGGGNVAAAQSGRQRPAPERRALNKD